MTKFYLLLLQTLLLHAGFVDGQESPEIHSVKIRNIINMLFKKSHNT